MPYFAWADANKRLDAQLFSLADEFAHWLYVNWEVLRHDSNQLVFHILPNHVARFSEPGKVNLVIIVDNLGWQYVSFVKELFQEIGFASVQTEPYFAMLPSSTEISKKCLLSGEAAYAAIDHKQYAKIVEHGWVPFFKDKTPFHYLPTIEHLRKLRDIKDETYFVNYLPVDSALHQKESELGLPHCEHIPTLLRRLVDNVAAWIEQHHLGEKIVIHLASDHGSTRIPASLPNDLDLTYFQDSDFRPASHRVAPVTPERFSRLPDNFKEDCFFLERGRFRNEQHYLCARRSNRFLAATAEHYVHGGLSPEEVIVPYLVFQKITVPIEPLTLFLQHATFRYRLETITFELGNPNEYRVEQIEINLLNSNVHAEPEYIESCA